MKKNKSTYYKCPHCGSEEFIKHYNLWDEEIKVRVTPHEKEGEEDYWDVENQGVIKDHLVGYRCSNCGEYPQELNDGL